MSSKRPPLLTRLSVTWCVRGDLWYPNTSEHDVSPERTLARFGCRLGLGRRMTTPPEHSSRKHLRPQRHLNVLQCDTAFFFPPLWFLRVWWRSSSSFSFEDSFALKGFWSWTCLANPKCQYYFVLYVCVCQLNVITDPTALISIWYLIGRSASSILKMLFKLF